MHHAQFPVMLGARLDPTRGLPMDKRTFLKNAGLIGMVAPLGFSQLQGAVAAVERIDPRHVANDEEMQQDE